MKNYSQCHMLGHVKTIMYCNKSVHCECNFQTLLPTKNCNENMHKSSEVLLTHKYLVQTEIIKTWIGL